MSMNKFFKESILYRLIGGHASDHLAMGVTTVVVDSVTSLRAIKGSLFTTAQTTGYYSKNDGGSGLYRVIATTVGSYLDNGGMVIIAADGCVWGLVPQNGYNIRQFGAKGNGVFDDTPAIQTAINTVLTQNGGSLYAPPGTYLLTGPLNIPFSCGWRFYGASRGEVIFKQSANNTPIFYFSQNNTWGFTIEHISGTWSTPQPATNTAAIMFSFYGSSAVTIYNFYISDTFCSNGFRGISGAPGNSAPIWGFKFEKYIHASNMSGGAVNMNVSPSVGQPNISIKGIYVRADNMAASEYAIAMEAADTFTIDDVEINNTLLGAGLLRLDSSNGHIGTIKSEVSTYAVNPSSQGICYFSNSQITISYIELITTTINNASGINFISVGGGSNTLTVLNTVFGFTSITGKFYAYSGGGYPAFNIDSGQITGLIGQANAWLTNVGSQSTANNVNVRQWNAPPMQMNGDANISINIGSNSPTQLFNTNLTIPRTVTLADQADGADSNLYTGYKWRIVNQQPTYANPITLVSSGGGTVATLAANGYVEVAWYRFGWAVVGYGTWVGVNP